MPHAVLLETDWDAAGGVAAYAGELPGCAVFAGTADEAVGAIPGRVAEFIAWLNQHGESLPSFAGGNWYEVERVAAERQEAGVRRARFSLDDLPPSEDEFTRYLRWLELAREELAEALDRADSGAGGAALTAIAEQDRQFVTELGGDPAGQAADDPVDRLFAARDALAERLETAGAGADGVRRVLRLAIADDLRVADWLGPD